MCVSGKIVHGKTGIRFLCIARYIARFLRRSLADDPCSNISAVELE